MSQSRPRMPMWAIVLLGILAGLVVMVGIAWFGVWLFTARDEQGKDILDVPTATVVVAFLALVGGVVTSVGAPLAAVFIRRLGDITHQVQNSHTENLRDDIDGKHDILAQKIDALKESVDGRLDRVESRVDRAEKDIDDLEALAEKHHSTKGSS